MRIACFALIVLLLSPLTVWSQISRPTDAELDAAPPQFQDLVRGRSDKVNVEAGRAARPVSRPDAAPHQVAINPSKNLRDFSGNWRIDAGPPSGPLPTDPRPGRPASTTIDANRMCLVALGVNPATMKVYQSDQRLTFIYRNELRARRIHFAVAHDPDPPLTYSGHSIARWEGNTLVVDTVAIKGVITMLGFDVEVGARTVLLATPALRVVERIFRSADGQQLTIKATWTDPSTSVVPYTKTTLLTYAADAPSHDFECEDVGDRFGPDYGGGVP